MPVSPVLEAVTSRTFTDPKSQILILFSLKEKDIGGLEVAVCQPVLMDVVEPSSYLLGPIEAQLRGRLPLLSIQVLVQGHVGPLHEDVDSEHILRMRNSQEW